MSQQIMKPWQYWSAIIFAGVTTLGGAALIIFGINFLRQGAVSKNWPVAQGTIQAAKIMRDVDRDGSRRIVRHYITVSYDYEVDGQQYSGDRYSLGDGSTASKRFKERGEAIAEKAKYPTGNEIDVYYKPDEPSFAILKPGINVGTVVPLVLGLLFLPTGIGCGLLVFKSSSP